MTKLYPLRWLFTLLLFFSLVPLLTAATITVTNTSDSADSPAAGSLRNAVRTAASGDSIVFAASTNGSTFTLEEALVISNKNLTIVGNGMDQTVLSGDSDSRIFRILGTSQVRITRLYIRDGFAAVGGGIRVRDVASLTLHTVTISDCVAAGNEANQGGGAISSEGTLILNRVLITNNTALGTSGSGGGIINQPGGTLIVKNSMISNNQANRAGGGIEDASGEGEDSATAFEVVATSITGNTVNMSPGNGGGIHVGGNGDVMVYRGEVSNNTAGNEGGGIWLGSGMLTIRSTLVDNNEAQGDASTTGGGGLFNLAGTMIVNPNTRVTNNRATGEAGSGGGILNLGGSLRVNDATVSSNTANRAGGGIEDASGPETSFLIFNARIDSNTVATNPGNGGGIHVGSGGGFYMRGGSVSFNVAGSEGGGLWNDVGRMSIRSVLVANNEAQGATATEGGGGVYNNGGMLVVNPNTRILDNSATGESGSGGGIFHGMGGTEDAPVPGMLRINDATIAGNTANRAGGGLEDASGPTFISRIVSSRINNNTASSAPGNGGGVHVGAAGNLNILRSVVNGNTAASEGGGLWNDLGEMNVRGVIVSGNTASGDDATMGGGGIYNNGGTLNVNEDTQIRGNVADGTAGSGGGVLNAEGGILTVTEAIINANEAERAGGGVEDASGELGGLFVVRSTIDSNEVMTSPGNGGGIHVGGAGDASIQTSSVSHNTAGAEGGGLWNGQGNMSVFSTVIDGNVAAGDGAPDNIQGGGGIYNDGGTVEVSGSTQITNNSATGTSGSGGGILSAGDVTDPLLTSQVIVIESVISSNTANRAGGGVEVAVGSYSSFDVDYDGNDAGANPGNGGALHVSDPEGSVDFNGGSVTNNVAFSQGGGLWNQTNALMEVTGVSITGNSVLSAGTGTGERVAGGGIYNNGGDLNVSSSTIADNVLQTSAVAGAAATTAGGGIANDDGGSLSVLASTISGNTAESGGGIANVASASIINTTIVDNTAATGGGIAQSINLVSSTGGVASLSIQGSILSDNDAAEDPNFSRGGGDANSGGYNFLGNIDGSDLAADGNDVSGPAAELGMLMDNGGMTFTYMPNCGSPVVGAGNPNDDRPDQIGQSVVGTRDIGSFELQAACASVAGGSIPQASARTAPQRDEVGVYPNPSRGSDVRVTIPESFKGEVTMRIYDAAGRIHEMTTRASIGTYRLELDGYQAGSYILQVVNGDDLRSVRFVITE
ncbi:T9SS type A sorting domain-containing protein [Neolewinella sp.]|uniref:T9SS type A sorting domain-containing protein n=1 Tax=Neolewinella sp. TaxID=2993543 RepID=UPI003B527FF8